MAVQQSPDGLLTRTMRKIVSEGSIPSTPAKYCNVIYDGVPEWSKGAVCKTVKSWVQIPPSSPVVRSRNRGVVQWLE